MSNFNQEEFNKFVAYGDIIGFYDKPKELKFGRMSNLYINWRKQVEDVAGAEILAKNIINFTLDKGLDPCTFYGVPEGATIIGIITQYQWAKKADVYGPGTHSFSMGRGKPKEHGDIKDKYFVGVPKGKTIIIEDVTTTGGSLLNEIDRLQEANIEVIAAYGLTNRMERRDDGLTVKEAVAKKGVEYYALSTADVLLPMAIAHKKPSNHILQELEKEFKEHGVEALAAIELTKQL